MTFVAVIVGNMWNKTFNPSMEPKSLVRINLLDSIGNQRFLSSAIIADVKLTLLPPFTVMETTDGFVQESATTKLRRLVRGPIEITIC
jgi:hypothetical protein|tara:strand:- start:3220 stop:3483 length:264 start_codon:yes stop_codon:yes gene_type:complete